VTVPARKLGSFRTSAAQRRFAVSDLSASCHRRFTVVEATLIGYTTDRRGGVTAREIEDACLSSWRDASVEIGLLTEGGSVGLTVFHGSLKHHDENSVLLATEGGIGLLLISRRAIAYIRPRSRPIGASSWARHASGRNRQGTGHR
jgi:hypothetical protein